MAALGRLDRRDVFWAVSLILAHSAIFVRTDFGDSVCSVTDAASPKG